MTAKNDVTGDKIKTSAPSEAYLNNYDAIFRKDKKPEPYVGTNKTRDMDGNSK